MATSNPESGAHETIDQVAGKLHSAVDKAAAGLGSTEERLRHDAAEATARLREGREYAKGRSEDMLESVTSYARENPLMALGIAFVAGSIFSALRRRR